jgi:hypothetical protein
LLVVGVRVVTFLNEAPTSSSITKIYQERRYFVERIFGSGLHQFHTICGFAQLALTRRFLFGFWCLTPVR